MIIRRIAFLIITTMPAVPLWAQTDSNLVPLLNNFQQGIYRSDGTIVMTDTGYSIYGIHWFIRSTDFGTTYTALDSGRVHRNSIGAFVPGHAYYISRSGPIYRMLFDSDRVQYSRDNGDTWKNALPDSVQSGPGMQTVATVATDGSRLIYEKDDGFYSIAPGGDSAVRIWDSPNYGMYINSSWCDSLHGIIFAQNFLVRTTNGGLHWDTLAAADSAEFLLGFADQIIYHTPSVLTAISLQGLGACYTSFDTGRTW